jgi:CRP/FNR family cyclic AMP-dependent transcriptional regulator
LDADILRAIPMFAAMDDEHLRRVAAFATTDSASSGSVLLREGDFSTELVAIEEGTADVMRDGKLLATLGPGDIFGEMGVLEKQVRTATVVATSRVRLIKLTDWDVKRLAPEVRARLREVVEERRSRDGARAGGPAPA